MNSEEQTLIDGLFARLKKAEAEGGPRDAPAEQRIREHLAGQPAAPYYMAQAILVQEAALKRLDEQKRQLQADLDDARARAQAPAQAGGGFLSNLFGGGNRDTTPAPRSNAGGWREPNSSWGQPSPPVQQGYAAQPQALSGGGGFMRGALQTAAGVAGGVMLAEGISSLFHHGNAPQDIVEVIREEPMAAEPLADQSGTAEWNNDDRGGFANTDWGSDGADGGFFDDDDYV
ncbi:DUF2076 domain-containing protein [Pseudomonas typographi]|uniref:DUF2076 domain-containing protein n=1 Tax=Pseudomonas typographi TaxID=2715964 RepID=A0ABR7Z6H9_9PSED|nr:DUF2076 domain-containing protein [Pseudomonas typographi]MBD1553508.1 DUF2076 domain-containing protein [Pseudomonas typographi]MBD1588955.1 DUF2076 domain-containing protein [Pseudomonas typographi]MBD1600982.1 DUF2076 domain-containing protein [Pseudomonas typographi]